MRIGIPKECLAKETRVATTPQSIEQLLKLGFSVAVEHNAGVQASFEDAAFIAAGATITDTYDVWQSDIIFKVNAPTDNEITLLKNGSTLISFIWPAHNSALITKLADKKMTVMAMDAVPRISRAQSLDALSSMANIAGYRAIIEAAHAFGSLFSGQITAAGKNPPAKVMVIGAGVAGLAAIGTAGSLGAIVSAFDTSKEVKEQVHSMGAEFLELHSPEQIAAKVRKCDIIITTALIPGKPAPLLITKEMVASMKPGSVIVDIAASNGGNCELTMLDTMVVSDNGVRIIGYTDLPSRLPTQSSKLYSTNLLNLMKLLCPDNSGTIAINFNEIIIRQVTIMKNGEITWPAPPIKFSAPQPTQYTAAPLAARPRRWKYILILPIAILLFMGLANIATSDFMSHFTVFTLSCVVGYYVVWNISHALHTPLMSVTNALSGIIIVGALWQIKFGGLISCLSFIAVLIASINIVGGFTVTQRMLKMFLKHEEVKPCRKD